MLRGGHGHVFDSSVLSQLISMGRGTGRVHGDGEANIGATMRMDDMESLSTESYTVHFACYMNHFCFMDKHYGAN